MARRTLAKRDVHIGSTPSTLAAEMRDWSLSDCLKTYTVSILCVSFARNCGSSSRDSVRVGRYCKGALLLGLSYCAMMFRRPFLEFSF